MNHIKTRIGCFLLTNLRFWVQISRNIFGHFHVTYSSLFFQLFCRSHTKVWLVSQVLCHCTNNHKLRNPKATRRGTAAKTQSKHVTYAGLLQILKPPLQYLMFMLSLCLDLTFAGVLRVLNVESWNKNDGQWMQSPNAQNGQGQKFWHWNHFCEYVCTGCFTVGACNFFLASFIYVQR